MSEINPYIDLPTSFEPVHGAPSVQLDLAKVYEVEEGSGDVFRLSEPDTGWSILLRGDPYKLLAWFGREQFDYSVKRTPGISINGLRFVAIQLSKRKNRPRFAVHVFYEDTRLCVFPHEELQAYVKSPMRTVGDALRAIRTRFVAPDSFYKWQLWRRRLAHERIEKAKKELATWSAWEQQREREDPS